ncbi:hypothetical protein [Empedobacter falsenii]
MKNFFISGIAIVFFSFIAFSSFDSDGENSTSSISTSDSLSSSSSSSSTDSYSYRPTVNCSWCSKEIDGDSKYTHLGKMGGCYTTDIEKQTVGSFCSSKCCNESRNSN